MTPWIKRLLIANVAVFLVTFQRPELKDYLAFSAQTALQAPWTIITYQFTHANFSHLFWNMLALIIFGPRVEARLGGPRFLGLYFTAGISGALLSIALSSYGLVGASAAIYGVSLAYAMFWPWERFAFFFLIPMPAFVLVIVYGVISLFGGFGYLQPGVAHWAHLGGYAGAYLYLTLLKNQTGAQRFRAKAAPVIPVPKSTEVVDRWKRIDPGALHPVNREELTRILAKLDEQGAGALSSDERGFLDRFAASS
ncbi:MAG TPA: rhomboid family intramembrane serine protease [Gemmatimonadales bacterium]|nr:rhomboid family intramembrane serine protease [Gemmatimonadales bacterium]